MNLFNSHTANKHYHALLFVLLIAIGTVACEDKMKKVDAIDIEATPTEEAKDLRLVYSENGVLKNEITAPIAYRYSSKDHAYFLFPKGGMVRFYNAEGQLESTMVADSAVYRQQPTELMEGYINVKVRNWIKQQELETDTLYWNKQTQRIYTYHSKVKITTLDDTLKVIWMDADERFKSYHFKEVVDSPVSFDVDSMQDSTQAIPPVSPQGTVSTPVQPIVPAQIINDSVKGTSPKKEE